MELEEMKAAWAALEENLKQKDLINEQLLQETYRNKVNKILSKCMKTEVFGRLAIILFLSLIIWELSQTNNLTDQIFYMILFLVMLFTLFWKIKTIIQFVNMDLSQPVICNVDIISRYHTYNKSGTKLIIPVIIVLLVPVIIQYAQSNKFWQWFFLCSVVLALGIFLWWALKNYKREIKSVFDNIEKLKELEEE